MLVLGCSFVMLWDEGIKIFYRCEREVVIYCWLVDGVRIFFLYNFNF